MDTNTNINGEVSIGLLAGTTEGRVACHDLLQAGFRVIASVTTDYGAQCLSAHARLSVKIGKMDAEQMKTTFMREQVACVVDATHPYAQEASRNAESACTWCKIPYFRVSRPALSTNFPNVHRVQNVEEAVKYISGKQGNVLLTTGSHDLATFIRHIDRIDRLIARILPDAHVMQTVQQMGFSAEQIIAMKGPFSTEMNEAMIRAVQAKYLVSKDSGSIGGLQEKMKAAHACGIETVLIERPLPEEEAVELESVVAKVQEAVSGLKRCAYIADAECGATTKQETNVYNIKGFFPFFVDITGWKAVVIGGGKVATRRIAQLHQAGADVTVIAPMISDKIPDAVRKIERTWKRGDTAWAKIVLAATDSIEINRDVMQDSVHAFFKNSCNEPRIGNFFFPAIDRNEECCIALISGDARKSRKTIQAIRKRIRNRE